jgi:hypothetical protein
MKKLQLTLLLVITLMAFAPQAKSQGWINDKKAMYSIGVGGTQVLFLPRQYYPLGSRGSLGLSLNVAGEYKVHRWIGLGWQTGVNFFGYGRYYSKKDNVYYNNAAIGIPIGMNLNFHILEAANAKIKDRLDVYAGLNIGAGPSFHTGPNGGVYAFIYGGPQVGVRYWFDKVAIFGQLGWGATLVNLGVTF